MRSGPAGHPGHDNEQDRSVRRRVRAVTWRRMGCPAAVLAAVALTVLAGCGASTGPLPAPDGPPAHPRCGGPVLALGAAQLQRAYGVPAMLAAGINGAGTTIATVLPYANPQAAYDLGVYSRRYGLPPARLTVISYGHVLAAGSTAARHWLKEGDEDIEMMHALAPGAALIYLQVSDADELMYDQALSWLVSHIRPDVVSYSSGTPEYTGAQQDQAGLQAAAHAGVTVVAATGDTGATEPDGTTLYPFPVALWPASDPLVTAVGGTWLT